MSVAVEIDPISPILGAEVSVGDLRTASDGTIAELRAAIYAHSVVFLRDQQLSSAELLAVAERFGDPMSGPFSAIDPPKPVSTFSIEPGRPPRADLWHTDLSFEECPPAFGMLHSLVAPEAGGDTVFASSYAAYDSLSAPLQRWCEELMAAHHTGDGLRIYAENNYGSAAARKIEETFPIRHQPLVICHPHTGRRALYITGNFLQHIVGLHPAENDALLNLLRAPYDNPNFQVRWRWSVGDLAIWDQRAVNHRGLSDHYPSHPYRTMQSVFVGDGIPAASLAVRALTTTT